MRPANVLLLAVIGPSAAFPQFPDLGGVKLTFEQRVRYESREGRNFALARTRLGVSLRAAEWLRLSAMAQDSRAPWYGPGAPSTIRDPIDLQEGYVELFGERKSGFGMTAGRMMLNYGEARLIGSPQWSNLSRTWDHARLYYRLPKARLEALMVSPVKIRIGEFNRPVLGDRIWGTYNAFPNFYRKNLLEVYLLRHDLNQPGAVKLGVNTLGFRLAGPFAAGSSFSVEAALQTGKAGPAKHRAGAWFASLSRRWTVGKRTLDLSGEYKFASGTDDPRNPSRSGTFDQLYPANHDKFGHQDLFGWRNIHDARSLATWGLTRDLALNFMYNSFWLASARDSLYNGSGRSIAHSATGAAGRHVGQEADLFATFKHSHFQFGAGYSRFFKGGFINQTTPALRPTYLYVFHTVSF
jgi:hypothetical protein